MKRVSVVLIAAFVAASAMLVSCGEDTEEDNPQIEVRIGGGAPVSNGDEFEEEVGTMLSISIKFTMGKNPLANVKMYSKFGARPEALVLDSVLNSGIFSKGSKDDIDFTYPTNIGLDNEVLRFEAEDSKGRLNSFTLTLKPKAPELPPAGPDPVYFAGGVTTFGAQAHATMGSFYSVNEGKVYLIAGAKASANLIDFAYYHISGAFLAGPNDAGTNYGSGASNLGTWSKKNVTRFKKLKGGATISNANLVNIEKDEWDDAMGEVGAADPKTEALAQNDVYVFKTEGGKEGAFIVTNITGTTSGTLSIRFISEIE